MAKPSPDSAWVRTPPCIFFIFPNMVLPNSISIIFKQALPKNLFYDLPSVALLCSLLTYVVQAG